ncbi:exocyst complex component 6B-like isoform X2 [Lineus longissimus]|uniref:exocyst complex component 6B-like isoform X2 n=1 Tax=Lineus longissimus TaxID=88925 RepID=UPI00315DF1B9
MVQQDMLVTEIEATDGSMATALRAVYESEEPQKFMERLDARIKSHDKEIERMCNFHYQGFIDSIRELLQVRSDADTLQEEISNINGSLQKSGHSLIGKGEELIKCRKIQKNIAAAVEGLTLCLPVLETYSKLREQMKNKRYYPALKTLEQLEHTYLPRVSKYRFSQTMADHIPKLRENIKEASMIDLKDFLENIRKHSTKIGEVAMRHAAEQNNIDPSIAVTKQKRRAPAPPTNPFGSEVPLPSDLVPDHEDEEMSAQDVVDFSPVYRCLHIYSVLGARDTFESYYRKQRKKQARLALQPPPNMHESIEGYRKYFHDIIGFFVVEDHILNTTSGLVNKAYIDDMWEMALTKVVAMLRTNSKICTNPQLMLQLKNLIVLFSHTLRGYGFPVGQLYDLLLELRDMYSEVLMKKWVSIFDGIFNEDNYTPIHVESDVKYQEITSIYPFEDDGLEKSQFPKTFPFSHFVPKVYNQVKEYIYACLKFTDDLHLSQTEIDDMVRKSANVLLTRTLSGCLSALIKRPSLTLHQLIQISINMNYLEQSCVYLETFITNITGAEKDGVHLSRLHGTSMFKDSRSEAEAQIYRALNTKIDEFLDLATYDWTLQESKGHASGYVMDLLAFLESMFLSFTNLPPKVAQTACMSSCKYIAQKFLEFLIDPDIRHITSGALQQLNLDLMQCEQYANSEPVRGLRDTLLLAFADLRQLLDLFLIWDWSTYLADYGQPNSKYVRVHPNIAITLLEKMRDADKKKNIFTSLKQKEKDKRRLLETVLKQLRSLAASNGTGPHS